MGTLLGARGLATIALRRACLHKGGMRRRSFVSTHTLGCFYTVLLSGYHSAWARSYYLGRGRLLQDLSPPEARPDGAADGDATAAAPPTSPTAAAVPPEGPDGKSGPFSGSASLHEKHEDKQWTVDQKQHIMSTVSLTSFTIENCVAAVRRMAALQSAARLADFAALFGPMTAVLGMAIYFVLIFASTTDATMEYLGKEFERVQAQLTALEVEVARLTEGIQADKVLQTYIQKYTRVKQASNTVLVASALQDYLRAVQDPALLRSFVSQCDLYPPEGFLQYLTDQLTTDGSCRHGIECLLDPTAGIVESTAWSVPGYLQYATAFISHYVTAAQLATACSAARGATNETIQAQAAETQAQLQELTTNLRLYHDSVLCQGFWAAQFGVDIAQGLGGGQDNDAMATTLQAILTMKYTILLWSVAVWNAGTGSDLQGVFSTECDVDPPPPSCTATGGAFHKLRYGLTSGGEVSFMIFWSPVSEGASVGQYKDAFHTSVSVCAENAGTNDSDMVVLVGCMREQAPKARAFLCVKFGMGLRARTTNLYVENHGTIYIDENDMGNWSDGPMASFIVLST